MKIFNGCLTIDDAGKLTVTSAAIGSLTGVLKASSGDVAQAVADTDYQQPVTWGDGLTYSSGTADVDYTANLKITSNQLDTIQGIKTSDSPTFANVTADNAPTAPGHLTRKDWVESLLQGLKPKDTCLVATTGNITLSGEQTIDGVLTSTSRVLVWQQTDPKENGFYLSDASGWTRTTDADTGTEILGAFTKVRQGSSYGGDVFHNTNSSAPTIGSDNITFSDWGTTTNHNQLQSLQGGTTDEYYHMTAAEHTVATQAATTSLNGYLSSTDWTTFNGKEDVLTAGDGLGRSGDTLSVDYNTTNLKITSNQIDTIQSIATNAQPTFDQATLSTAMILAGLTSKAYTASLADEAQVALDTGAVGMGLAWIGDFEEWMLFGWTAAGAPTVALGSANAVNTNTDGKFCVIDAGTGPALKNRLGVSKTLRYVEFHS
jgi:hypothetical protein